MKNKRIIHGLLLVLTCFLLGACSSQNKKQEAKKDEPINLMSASEMTTLDTTALLDFPDAITQTAAFEGLYELDEHDKLVPAAAKSLPEISKDGKTYTIALRKDGRWSNGDPVTAHDFIYAWQRLADPKNARVYSFLLQECILNGAEVAKGEQPVSELGVKALDDYTLQIKLTEAKPYFISILAFPPFFPQNKKAVEQYGEKYGTSSEKAVYNGPFIVENWEQNQMKWDLKKNSYYHDAKKVKTQAIHYQVIKDSSTALNMYEDGKLDAAVLTGVLASENRDRPDYHTEPTGTISYIRLNQERKGQKTPLQNENLRKAFALGIDKKTMIEKVIADGSKPLYGLIPKGFVTGPDQKTDFRKAAGSLMKHDQKSALKYWKKAQKELGDNIAVELLVNDDDAYKKMAESIQGQLQSLFKGLTINITSLPTETALNRARSSDFDMFLIYWTPDYQDPISSLTIFASKNKANYGYQDKKYDQLLTEISTTYANDPEKRWEKMIEAERYLIEEHAGTIVLSQTTQSVLQESDLKGLQYHTFAAPVTLKTVYKK